MARDSAFERPPAVIARRLRKHAGAHSGLGTGMDDSDQILIPTAQWSLSGALLSMLGTTSARFFEVRLGTNGHFSNIPWNVGEQHGSCNSDSGGLLRETDVVMFKFGSRQTLAW